MEQVEQVLKKLELMNSKIDGLGDTVKAIDLSITGDTKRGVIGIKQHIESMQKDLHTHVKEDEAMFAILTDANTKTVEKFSRVKAWIAGASFVIVSLTSVAVFVINILIKAK